MGRLGVLVRDLEWINRSPLGMLKVNIDGSYYAATRNGGLGFVIRDFVGTMLAGGATPLQNLLSAEHAEALACHAAVKFVLHHNMMPVLLETDSLLVQRQVSAQTTSNTSVLGRLYDDIGEMMDLFPNVRINHTRRGANLVAHLLADHAKSLQQETFFFSALTFLQAAIASNSNFV
ncbi:uncharacterized protein LOC133711122 [Rosa rugosa]|uniref:uncharacterized protein LOC133711122 n=1 Tax=Rosa rugosa TaxID=74645 RepID=UPI002B416209|nr:uncharacterized protein LOC133711122 [Rosa rugosa]